MKNLRQILPKHEPPEAIWEKIAEELSPLREVGGYAPPESVWDSIEANLSPKPQIRPLWHWAVAASIVLVLGVGVWYSVKAPVEVISYSEEKAIPHKILPNYEVEQQYARIQALCLRQVAACEKPEFKTLKRELDDLTTASHQLREAMGGYNTDESLHQQFSQIEEERALILRRLTQQI